MSGGACARFAWIAERLAAGERLAPSERDFHDAHLSLCVVCSAEAALLAPFADAMDPNEEEEPASGIRSSLPAREPGTRLETLRDASIAATLSPLESGTCAALHDEPATPRRLRVAAAAIAIGAVAAASALFVARTRAPASAAPATVVAQPSVLETDDPQGVARVTVEPVAAANAAARASAAPRASMAAPMLERARTLRGEGRLREALSAYQTLAQAHATSAEASHARVAIAELHLSLGDPASALRAADEHLASGGSNLVEEASYARIRALRALGRTGEERAAAEGFVARWPASPQSPSLRQRLARPEPR